MALSKIRKVDVENRVFRAECREKCLYSSCSELNKTGGPNLLRVCCGRRKRQFKNTISKLNMDTLKTRTDSGPK